MMAALACSIIAVIWGAGLSWPSIHQLKSLWTVMSSAAVGSSTSSSAPASAMSTSESVSPAALSVAHRIAAANAAPGSSCSGWVCSATRPTAAPDSSRTSAGPAPGRTVTSRTGLVPGVVSGNSAVAEATKALRATRSHSAAIPANGRKSGAVAWACRSLRAATRSARLLPGRGPLPRLLFLAT